MKAIVECQKSFVGTLLLVLAASGFACSQEPKSDDGKKEANVDPLQAEYEQLEKLLSNAVFEGHFTMDGQDVPPKKERYELGKVRKRNGDVWMIQARIKYGDHNVAVPLFLPIKWAGKTAVITVDNVTIPGLGTFDSRVLISEGKYSGTWSHGKVGGHLFGKIIAADDKKAEKPDSEKPASDTSNSNEDTADKSE